MWRQEICWPITYTAGPAWFAHWVLRRLSIDTRRLGDGVSLGRRRRKEHSKLALLSSSKGEDQVDCDDYAEMVWDHFFTYDELHAESHAGTPARLCCRIRTADAVTFCFTFQTSASTRRMCRTRCETASSMLNGTHVDWRYARSTQHDELLYRVTPTAYTGRSPL